MSTTRQQKKVLAATFVGTMVEWYDFFLFGSAAAIVFPKVFFPDSDPAAGTLLSFATFAVTFVVRPLGGAIFGHFGDRIGRKKLLIITVSMMGGSTLLIGVIPDYGAIGLAAPILLVFLRILQGISVGGEYGGAVLMAVEHAGADRRGYFGGWVQMGSPAGLILADIMLLAMASLPDPIFIGWAWRIPFLFGGVLLVVALAIRMQIEESPEFTQVQSTGQVEKLPIATLVREYPVRIIMTAFAQAAAGIVLYITTVFGLSYGVQHLGYSDSNTLFYVIIMQAIVLASIPAFSIWSDRIGHRRVFVFGILGMAIMTVIWLGLFATGQMMLAILGFALLAIPYSMNWATTATFLARVYETKVGYSGLSIGYQLGTVLGGVAPFIATALYASFHSITPVIIYVLGQLALALIATWWLTPAPSPVVARVDHESSEVGLQEDISP